MPSQNDFERCVFEYFRKKLQPGALYREALITTALSGFSPDMQDYILQELHKFDSFDKVDRIRYDDSWPVEIRGVFSYCLNEFNLQNDFGIRVLEIGQLLFLTVVNNYDVEPNLKCEAEKFVSKRNRTKGNMLFKARKSERFDELRRYQDALRSSIPADHPFLLWPDNVSPETLFGDFVGDKFKVSLNSIQARPKRSLPSLRDFQMMVGDKDKLNAGNRSYIDFVQKCQANLQGNLAGIAKTLGVDDEKELVGSAISQVPLSVPVNGSGPEVCRYIYTQLQITISKMNQGRSVINGCKPVAAVFNSVSFKDKSTSGMIKRRSYYVVEAVFTFLLVARLLYNYHQTSKRNEGSNASNWNFKFYGTRSERCAYEAQKICENTISAARAA